MQTMLQLYNVSDSRLRFIFDDAVVSLNLAADATFETVAQKLSELPNHLPGGLVAIHVRLKEVSPKKEIVEDKEASI